MVSLANRKQALEMILNWLYQNQIEVVNVAGPRESSWPGIYNKSCELLREVFLVSSAH